MCRLFAVIANEEVGIDFSFNLADTPFKSLSKKNPDGWGIGYYHDGKAQVEKQGLDDVGSLENYDFSKVHHVKSRIIISHVRKATCGDKSSVNAHPFRFKNWIFAHNGGIDKKCSSGYLERYYKEGIKGETDSEVFFLLLVQEIERLENPVEGIKNALRIVYDCGEYTGLNFILSDGYNIYAYRDAARCESYYSLYFLNRDPSHPFEYLSEDTRQMLLSKLPGEKAVLICSEKLTKEKWEEIPLKTLLVVNSDLQIKQEKLST